MLDKADTYVENPMAINLGIPEQKTTQLKPRISVIGVGGAGGNAVNNMIEAKLEGVEFIVANTDAQALERSKTDRRIQLGAVTTQGLGAGARPEVGKAAAEEAIEEVMGHLEGSNMVFITAGMGGGTGTGAAPVIAKNARERGILTVGVVTKPFQFEGKKRMELAEKGIEELSKNVDTIIVIPNQNLFYIANKDTTFTQAFELADQVLHSGVRSVTDLIIQPGLINLDFADVHTVMEGMGKAIMGTGEAEGEDRAKKAAMAAISNPLLDTSTIRGAEKILINITGGRDLSLFEVNDATDFIGEEVGPDANIIFGSCLNEELNGKIRVSVVATGIDATSIRPEPRKIITQDKAPEVEPEVIAEEEAVESPYQGIEIKSHIETIIEDDFASEEDDVEEQSFIEEYDEEIEDDIEDEAVEIIATEHISEMPKTSEVIPSMPHATKFFAEQKKEEDSDLFSKAEVVAEETSHHVSEHKHVDAPAEVRASAAPASISAISEEAFIPAPAQTAGDDILDVKVETIEEEIVETEAMVEEKEEPRKFLSTVTGLSLYRKKFMERKAAEKGTATTAPKNGTYDNADMDIPAFLRNGD